MGNLGGLEGKEVGIVLSYSRLPPRPSLSQRCRLTFDFTGITRVGLGYVEMVIVVFGSLTFFFFFFWCMVHVGGFHTRNVLGFRYWVDVRG